MTTTDLYDIKKKALLYFPGHQRVSELYLLTNNSENCRVVTEEPFSIDNSLEILKNNYTELYANLAELKIRINTGSNNIEESEDFIIDRLSDTESEEEDDEGIEEDDSVDDDTKYESESEFSE